MVDIQTETKMAAPMLKENAVFVANSCKKKKSTVRRLILNQFFSDFEQYVKFWMTLQALLVAGRHMFAQDASTN